jgi:CHAD domain-containing protein
MVRVLEIVLDIVVPTPCPATDENGQSDAAQAAALAAAFAAALPQLAAPAARGERVSTVVFDREALLARDGWRVAVETCGGAREVAVSRRHTVTPGVTALTPIFSASLDQDDMANALFEAAPEPFREALAAVGEPLAVAAVDGVRYRWPWASEGVEAELILESGLRDRMAPHDAASAAPCLHELRLRAPWPDGTEAAPIVQALFACGDTLVDAASTDAPAFVRMTDALARAASGSLAGDAEAVRAEPVDLAGASTDEAALVAIGRNISAQWFGNDAGVRDSPKTEFIHQMRVSQRRLRTAMRIFKRWQDDTWTEHIKPDLAWLGDLLGDARDRDVFVESTLPALAAADAEPARWDAMRAAADSERLAARVRVRDALHSPRYGHLALAWLRWLAALADRAATDDEFARSLHEEARKRVRRYYRRLAETKNLTAIDEASRHEARIQAKYLRYTLEFFTPLLSRRTRTGTVRTLARLQGVLGDGNDAAVGLRFIEGMDVEPYQLGFARGWCEAVKLYTAKDGERLLRELRRPKVSGD